MSWEMDASELQGQGRLLPDNVYVAVVEEAVVEETENGVRVSRRYGSLRLGDGATEFQLADGSMFKIGERKLFARSWWSHETSEQSVAIGHKELAKEAIAAGLCEKPKKGEKFVFPFATAEEYVAALIGKTLKIRSRQKNRMRKQGDGSKQAVLDEDGQQVVDVNVADWQRL